MPSSAPALPCPFGHFRARSGTLHDRSLQHQPLRGLPSIAHVSTNLFVTFGDSRPPSASLLVTIRGSRPPVTSSPTFPGPFGDSRPPLSSAPAFRDCSGSSRPPLCNAVRARGSQLPPRRRLECRGRSGEGGEGEGEGGGGAERGRTEQPHERTHAEGGEGWLKTSTPPCGSQWPCVCVCVVNGVVLRAMPGDASLRVATFIIRVARVPWFAAGRSGRGRAAAATPRARGAMARAAARTRHCSHRRSAGISCSRPSYLCWSQRSAASICVMGAQGSLTNLRHGPWSWLRIDVSGLLARVRQHVQHCVGISGPPRRRAPTFSNECTSVEGNRTRLRH